MLDWVRPEVDHFVCLFLRTASVHEFPLRRTNDNNILIIEDCRCLNYFPIDLWFDQTADISQAEAVWQFTDGDRGLSHKQTPKPDKPEIRKSKFETNPKFQISNVSNEITVVTKLNSIQIFVNACLLVLYKDANKCFAQFAQN